MKNEIFELIEISKCIGERPDLIQGGGGNTSVKLDERIMAIKSSGTFLKDMTRDSGISFVDYKAIRDFISGPRTPDKESSMNAFIKGQNLSHENIPMQRPSIETGFHAVLDKYVIHSHSVYANLLTCAQNGADLVRELFPESSWIPYQTPGAPLTLAIAEACARKPQPLYFIENHGVISTATTRTDALEAHANVERVVKTNWSLADYENFPVPMDQMSFLRAHVLFPDQVVYTLNDEVIHSSAAQETIHSYFYILEMLKNNSLRPHFLERSQVDVIHNLESEKYRKGLLKT